MRQGDVRVRPTGAAGTLALRPEGTASVVRAFVQHRPPVPWKAWYVTPAFRYERPQAGRYRQHHQLGVEVLGTDDPDLDVEVIALAAGFYADLGLRRRRAGGQLDGLTATCRPAYLAALARLPRRAHATSCATSTGSAARRNPLRVLDCKRPACRAVTDGAPRLVDYLVRAVRRPLRPGARRASTPLGIAYRARPPPRARPRLLHPHDLRVRRAGARAAQNARRRRRPLRRAGRGDRRAADPGHRLRHRHRAAPAGLRRRGRVRRSSRRRPTLRGRRRPAARRPATCATSCAGPGWRPTAPTTAAR